MAIPKNTTIPQSTGNFMKLEVGANKFRILSDIRLGWEGWKDNKPFRHEGADCRIKPTQVDLNQSSKPNINYFWAMAVWNYATEQVQVLEITQKTIMNSLFTLEEDEDWGDLKNYNITITKTKTGDKTKYETLPAPAKPVSAEIENAYVKSEIDKTIEEMFNFTPDADFDPSTMPAMPIIDLDEDGTDEDAFSQFMGDN